LSTTSDAEARSFAETRRTLLDALDRTEQEAHDQATELVRLAERRAREITVKADQSAALLEEQLTYLTAQLDHVRARVTDIRTRLAHELQGDRTSTPLSRAAMPPQPGRQLEPASASPITLATQDAAQSSAAVNDTDSLPETLRVLRAALESLNGQPEPNRPPRHA
jgi:hypothetical protein